MGIKSFFIKPSTEAFFKEADKLPWYTRFDRLHGYVYGRWTYLYISLGTGRHPLAKKLAPLLALIPSNKKNEQVENRGTADEYHGKTIPLETATRLVLVNEPVNIPDLEQVIPYKKARALILQNPDHIVALDCPCRSALENPCLPLDVCLVVGEPFASFVREHHPDKTRWITQAEAVAILKAEDERGHVHHAFFKDAMLGRFYAICNCCSCCCGAMHAHQNGTPMLASSGYVSQVDRDLCISCESCATYCQFEALSYEDGIAFVDEARCMGCGVCVSKCPVDALSLRREESKGIPLELCRLADFSHAQTG
jgi:Pyruvate/2-oxoacid:ferredoxin oxidoreductase delta subunit